MAYKVSDVSQDVLSKQDVLKAIRKHEAVEAVGGLNNEQIDAVLRAYMDVIWVACLNRLSVRFGYLGIFEPIKNCGTKSWVVKNPNSVQKSLGVTEGQVINSTKPHMNIRFRVGKTAKRRLRELTEDMFNEEI